MPAYPSSQSVVYGQPSPWHMKVDYDASNNPIYVGRAAPGNADPALPVWQIQRITFDPNNNPTDIALAGGSDSFANVWNNRASLMYS